MIITRRKPFSEIIRLMGPAENVFLLGCALCATVCGTGGEKEIHGMRRSLEKEGRKVTGWEVLDPACNLLEVKRLYRRKRKEIDSSDIVLSLTCGGGTQAFVEVVREKGILPGNDTLFQGEISELTLKKATFSQKCSLCGECTLDLTAGICPTTRCPKGLMNGPCGGAKHGKCEIDKDMDCAWVLIFERLKAFGRLDAMAATKGPKDHSKKKTPQSLTRT